ncbi:MAG: GHKL domain-containing protein [Gammaproteobacteria bacterium]|nr:GHKL domain-containing protein [Gammaproteobacteria bacterium]
MTPSLNLRLLLAASIVLAAFFGVTGLVLDNIYYRTAQGALQERLQSYAYSLIAAAELDESGAVQIAHPTIADERFFRLDSHIYARIVRNDGRYLWRSPSSFTVDPPFPSGFERTRRAFTPLTLPDGAVLLGFSTGVAWSGKTPREHVYTVNVAEDLGDFNAQIRGFRHTLWGALGVVAVVLLAVQGAVLRWGLAPLRRVVSDLAAIDEGRKHELDEDYPRELLPLTTSLNSLVQGERERRERYRHALDDLAHSLKTPLAVLRGAADAKAIPEALDATMRAQIDRRAEIVDYQLRRASTFGRRVMEAAVPVAPVARKVIDALDKAYRDKQVRCRLDVAPDLRFHGDEGDLMEILGNLLDNACKWCRHEVILAARPVSAGDGGARAIELRIEDDGPGMPEAIGDRLFERGARADVDREGHGIGLAVVRDIVRVYGGTVELRRGKELGGAEVVVNI